MALTAEALSCPPGQLVGSSKQVCRPSRAAVKAAARAAVLPPATITSHSALRVAVAVAENTLLSRVLASSLLNSRDTQLVSAAGSATSSTVPPKT